MEMIEDESEMRGATGGGGGNDAIDESFLNNFRSMGTSSRDDLIRQFKALISTEISDEHCEFFLDSSSWNLQVALCLYFDTNLPQQQYAAENGGGSISNNYQPQPQPLNLVPAAPQHSPKSHVPTPVLTPELDWDTVNLLDEQRPSPLVCENKQQQVEAGPGQIVTTTWLIRNTGDAPYAGGLHLMPVAAPDDMPRVPITEPIGPNQTVAVFTEVPVHHLPGVTYSMFWHVADSQNRLLSEPLTLRIKVLPQSYSGATGISSSSVDDAMMDS